MSAGAVWTFKSTNDPDKDKGLDHQKLLPLFSNHAHVKKKKKFLDSVKASGLFPIKSQVPFPVIETDFYLGEAEKIPSGDSGL